MALACLASSVAPALGRAAPDAKRHTPGASDCVPGWLDASTTDEASLNDVLTIGPDEAIAVGVQVREGDSRRAVVQDWDGSAWGTLVLDPVLKASGLLSVAGSKDDLWAVGYADRRLHTTMLAEHGGASGSWTVDSPQLEGVSAGQGAALTGVGVLPDGEVWAVGFRWLPDGSERPTAWQHLAVSGWQERDPWLPAAKRAGLYGMTVTADGDVWAVGSLIAGGVTSPLLTRWDGTSWHRTVLHLPEPESYLQGITSDASGGLWAVGTATNGDRYQALVEHWDGTTWSRVDPPAAPSRIARLEDVSVSDAGVVWAVGTAYMPSKDGFVTWAARRANGAWRQVPFSGAPGFDLRGVSGEPDAKGWAVGHAGNFGVRTRGCAGPGSASRPRAASGARPVQGRSIPVALDDVGDRPPRPIRGLPPVPAIAEPRDPWDVNVADVAGEAGLGMSIRSHGASVADLNGDRQPDLFISGHGSAPSMWLDHAGTFTESQAGGFPQVDRHDCGIADLDGDQVPDLYCSVGADVGLGTKRNEAWLHPTSGPLVNTAVAIGAADAIGRGRTIELFDANGDGATDIFVGNSPSRYDGLPSPNRLLLNDGSGRFSRAVGSGLDLSIGAYCAQAADVDRDGELDLLVCGHSSQVVDGDRTFLFHNDGSGRFTDVTAALHVTPLGDVDDELVDLNGDGRLDLVQLSQRRLRVSLQLRTGTFGIAYEASLTAGHGLATGDVDGDGLPDIYVQRGASGHNDPDLMLLNTGRGRSFTSIDIPQVSTGTADDVQAIDYDGNGLTDFLVLNGANCCGPVELIAFFPAALPAGG